MASSMKTFIIVVIAVIVVVVVPRVTLARDYVVGDADGWRLQFNYTVWAEGKEFHVGDSLVFQYDNFIHSVCIVDEADFQACNVPPANKILRSGNDTVLLSTPGMNYYICGQPNHCHLNQKLAINVSAATQLVDDDDF